MMSTSSNSVVMSIYLNSRGIAFVLFEGPLTIRDWSGIEVRGKYRRERLLERSDALLIKYRPDCLVLQDTSQSLASRPLHIRLLNEAIADTAKRCGIPVRFVSRDDVRRQFGNVAKPTKDKIAGMIAEDIPVLRRLKPPPRKAWMSEHPRMGIFDAAGLALAFFAAPRKH